jgi:site-specific DNA-methyltransferase (adenine-specific)
MWVFGSQRMFLERIGEFAGWDFVQDVVWEKHNGSSLNNDRFRRVHELALHFRRSDSKWADVYRSPQVTMDASERIIRKKGRPAHWRGAEKGEIIYKTEDGGPKLMRSVIFARSEHGRAVHPTQKPLSIVEPLLLYSCPPAGRVLDPFAGSGTTGVVAARHGIQATLIESDPGFAPTIHARLSDDAPLLAELHDRAADAWSEAGR